LGLRTASTRIISISQGRNFTALHSFHRDADGFLLLNVDMPTASIAQRLRIWESAFYQRGARKDFECPPSGRLLKASYKNGDYLRVEFRSIATREEFAATYPAVHDIGPV
jgi:hypothetical protein